MKIIKTGVIIALTLLTIACSNKEGSGKIEQLNENQNQTIIENKVEFLDSINDVGSQISFLKSSLDSKRGEIKVLTQKRDSLKNVLAEVEASLVKVNDTKINPGINGVNLKLNELKGQKENFQEQVSLQKQEITLANKKIELLKEEKIIYDEQRNVLWDKGAAPSEFVQVDSLLAGITTRIFEQKTRLKNLNRNVSDIEEQISIIGEQRTNLSTKIRNNYTAKEILNDFSKEEKDRINKQLIAIDEQLKLLLSEESEMNNQLAIRTGEKADFENKQSAISEEAKLNELALTKEQQDASDAKKKSRVTYAIIGISLVTLLFALFYFVGKNKKSKKIKK